MRDSQLIEDLRYRFNSGEKLKYVFFWRHQSNSPEPNATCFSQWYESPFVVDRQRYATAEHFMMAYKAALFKDDEIRARILTAPHPGAAKELGRQVRGYDQAVWESARFDVVVRANHAKFSQHPVLGQFLKATGSRILVEASPVDTVWGIGMADDHQNVLNPNLWRGLNLLGFALMQVREDFNVSAT